MLRCRPSAYLSAKHPTQGGGSGIELPLNFGRNVVELAAQVKPCETMAI
jgi:hypothetical protein